eukprot:gene12916-8773_t
MKKNKNLITKIEQLFLFIFLHFLCSVNVFNTDNDPQNNNNSINNNNNSNILTIIKIIVLL